MKICEQYLHKGSKIYLQGQIQTRKWADKDGVEKYSTEIVLQKFRGEITMLDGKKSDDRPAESGGGGSDSGREDFSADLDDEVPFASNRSIW